MFIKTRHRFEINALILEYIIKNIGPFNELYFKTKFSH